MDPQLSQQFQELRERAQQRLNDRISLAQHELEVYQTEIEIQHEELRRAHLELSALYEQYWYLYEFAPCGYLTLNHNYIITKVNQKAVELLGVTESTITYLGFSRFITPDHQQTFYQALERSKHSLEIQNLELQLIRTEDQSHVWVILNIRPSINLSGQVRQWQITLTELSEEKENQ